MLTKEYKITAAKFAREGKTKLELVMSIPKANSEELKQINNFYNASKEIIDLKKKGTNDKVLLGVLKRMGYSKEDLELIEGNTEIKNILTDIGTTLVSLLFVLIFVFVLGSLMINIISTTDWDFMKKDYTVSGFFFGEDTNFSDLNITTNAVLKNFSINKNKYSATVRCSKELTLSFTKKGFVPIHKNILCESQELDILFAPMSEFVKLDFNKTTKVEDKGVKLDVNANDLVVIGTNKAPVNPSVSVTAFNPNTPGDMQYFPGELEGIQEDGNIAGLESYGFAKIIAEDENANRLDFKNGKSAIVTFPLDSKQNADAPSEMPLWYFSEENGIWVEEGIAKKTCVGNNCQYVGQINKIQFYWNLALLMPISWKDINLGDESSFIVPFTPVKSPLVVGKDSNSRSINPKNEYGFMVISQSITKKKIYPNDFGKNVSFSYLGHITPRIAFIINNVPSIPKSFESILPSGNLFSGYSLTNCSFWEGYPTRLADCITGYDTLFGLNSNEAGDYVSKLNLSNRDSGIVYTKLADYYSSLNFCYTAFGKNYYFGLACIKMIDQNKSIDLNKNIFNIVNKNMVDYDLSFTFENLAEYYNNREYCLSIPLESQRLVCLEKFPKPSIPYVPKQLCGNGVVDELESCDENNFANKTCASYGFDSGNLFCVSCQINKSGCYNAYNDPNSN